MSALIVWSLFLLSLCCIAYLVEKLMYLGDLLRQFIWYCYKTWYNKTHHRRL